MANASFWRGIIPTIRTPLDADDAIDHTALIAHANYWADTGCTAVIALSSRVETQSLSLQAKSRVLRTLVSTLDGRAPVIAGIDASSTRAAVALARLARELGCGGLMVSPHYGYPDDWSEVNAHLSAVIRATPLPCMLYIQPSASRANFSPTQLAALAAQCPNLQALKELSCEMHYLAQIRELLGNRLELLFDLVLSPDSVPRFVHLSRLIEERRHSRSDCTDTLPPTIGAHARNDAHCPIGDVVAACPAA